MKTKILGGIAIVAIAVAVAFNVSVSNQKQDKVSLLALANVDALAQSEGGGGSDWFCSTYTSNVTEEYTEDCYDNNNNRVRKISERYETRLCNSGLLSFCYPGEIYTSFDCEGNSSVTDNTERSTCF
jgi:hypothetical protein